MATPRARPHAAVPRARRQAAVALTLLAMTLSLPGALAACGGSGTTSSSSSASGSSTGSAAATGSGSSTSVSGSTSGSAGQIGFEGVPLEQGPQLAPASTTGTGVVDGIHCAAGEQLTYHIHAHLAVFDDGRLYSLPAGIGIPGSTTQSTPAGPIAAGGRCIYWLHTHTDDGVIHIESPTVRVYTLGDFFHIWHQPLGPRRVASLRGAITTLVDGKPWKRTPRAVPLRPHEDIQLEIGQPAPPVVRVDWARTQL